MGLLLTILRKIKRLEDPLVRDFTEDTEAEMIEIAKDVNDSDDLFSKYVTDPIGRWLDKKGYLEVLCGLERYQKCVIDCYNYSAQNISKICFQARHFDSLYGQTVADCADQGENVVFLVKNLAECIDVTSKHYDDEPISQRLFGFFSKEFDGKKVAVVVRDADQLYDNDLKKDDISEDNIVNFCYNSDNITLFEDYTDYIFNQEMDWSALDIVFLATGTVIYKGVEMTVDELTGILSKEGYNEKLIREQLNIIISSVISADTSAQTVMKEYDTAKESVETLIEQYLDDEDNNTAFKSFVEAMGGITAVKELAKTCPQLLDYLFSDYTKGLEIIEDIAQTCDRSGSAEMRAAIDRLREEYQSKWKGLLHKTKDFSVDMISELSEKSIKDWIKKEISDTFVLFAVLDMTGMEDKVDGSHKLIALRKIVYELQDAYEEAIEKIKSGNYTAEDLTYAENMFNMLKEATKLVYKTYRDMCDDPSKQIWLNDQIENLERVSMRS